MHIWMVTDQVHHWSQVVGIIWSHPSSNLTEQKPTEGGGVSTSPDMMIFGELHENLIVLIQLEDSCISSVISGVIFGSMITWLNDHLAVLDQLQPWWSLSSSMIEEAEIINTVNRCSEDTCENNRAFNCRIHCIFIRSVCQISQQYGQ